MKRYAVILAGTVLALAATVAAAVVSTAAGSQQTVRSFPHVARQHPNTMFPAAKSLPQLKGVNFVSGCRLSHRNTDDPIIYPGQPGKSHDHSFLGNDTTNAFSTVETMLGQSTSCRRPGDTAGYWVPTLIGANGSAVAVNRATVYYRRHTLAALQTFPPGFKMIAGNSKATSAQGLKITSWNCGPAAEVRPQATIPTCPDAAMNGLALHVQFPDCWDGVNLDSADHQSHMAYSMRGRCPATHPVAMPALQVNIRYASAGGAGLVLASGGQLSGHADFFNTWKQARLSGLVNGCLNALRHCQQGV